MTSTIICFFTLKFSIGTSRKGDEDRDWKHSTSSCRQKPLSRLIFKRRTDAANRELDVNQRWLTGQGHFRGQSDFNWGRCPSGPTPRSAPELISSGLDECPIASVKATRPELPTLTLSPCDTRFCLFSLALTRHATYPITHAKQKKNTILGQVSSFSNS